MAKTGAGDATGIPSGRPVSAIAPDAAQSSTSHLSRMPHYPPHPDREPFRGRWLRRQHTFTFSGGSTMMLA
jgi:hypothetical protein